MCKISQSNLFYCRDTEGVGRPADILRPSGDLTTNPIILSYDSYVPSNHIILHYITTTTTNYHQNATTKGGVNTINYTKKSVPVALLNHFGVPQLGPVEAPFQTHHQLAVPDDRLGYQGLRLRCVVGEGPGAIHNFVSAGYL